MKWRWVSAAPGVRRVVGIAIVVCLLCALAATCLLYTTTTGAYLRVVKWGMSISVEDAIKIAMSDRYYPRVLEAMKRGDVRDPVHRWVIMEHIKLFRPGEYEAFLWAVHRDPDAVVRESCLTVLCKALGEHPEFMLEIIGALDDPDLRVASTAWRYVGYTTGVQRVYSDEVRPPPGTRQKWEKWWAEHKDKLAWDAEHGKFRIPEGEPAHQQQGR
jgi:hypothetical protein